MVNAQHPVYNFVGAPARTVGWRDPGFIHTSFLKELWPNSVYVLSNKIILHHLFRKKGEYDFYIIFCVCHCSLG